MSFKINQDCNNCRACEPECPNSAITQGNEIFEINSAACTECVGYFGEPQCAKVCPVDACHPDPNCVEDEAALVSKAKELNPEKDFSGAYLSHFKK